MTNVANYLTNWSIQDFDDRLAELRKRPEPLYGNIELPTVRDIDEAEFLCHEFGAVLTAGPDAREVKWKHPNHRVWTFDDTTDMLRGPNYKTVAEMVEWGAKQEDLLVHCHAGMSRSTATAWGVSIARGADPLDSIVALLDAHPREPFSNQRRLFIPNTLIITYLERILGDNNLMDIYERVLTADPALRPYV